VPTLVFDVGGTRIKAGLAHAGAIASTTSVATDVSGAAAALIAQLASIGRELTDGGALDAVGVSIRGIVDAEAGAIAHVNPPLTCLIGEPLAERLREAFGVPVHVENDARLHLLGELRHGRARGAENVVYVALGTGIGVAVALGGRILRGPHGTTGILGGHLTVDVDGPLCNCGNAGCLEAYIGTAAVVRDVRRRLVAGDGTSALDGRDVDPEAIFAAARVGDPVGNAAAYRFAHYLSAGVVSLVHAYDPDLVVFGGGLSSSSDVFLPHVREYVANHAWQRPQGPVRLETTELGDTAALIGAGELARGDIWAW
jgi:glucokinase